MQEKQKAGTAVHEERDDEDAATATEGMANTAQAAVAEEGALLPQGRAAGSETADKRHSTDGAISSKYVHCLGATQPHCDAPYCNT